MQKFKEKTSKFVFVYWFPCEHAQTVYVNMRARALRLRKIYWLSCQHARMFFINMRLKHGEPDKEIFAVLRCQHVRIFVCVCFAKKPTYYYPFLHGR